MSNSSQHPHRVDMPSTAYSEEAGHFYRFFSIDVGGRVALAEDHECASDRDAMALGNALLSERGWPKIEVWLRRGRIGALSRGALGSTRKRKARTVSLYWRACGAAGWPGDGLDSVLPLTRDAGGPFTLKPHPSLASDTRQFRKEMTAAG
jgi:hypothetical protein